MEIFLYCIGMLDAVILALLEVPVLSLFLIGCLVAACVGIFLMLSKAARGRR